LSPSRFLKQVNHLGPALERDDLEDLAARARAGEAAAFDRLAGLVSGRLLAYARGTLRDKQLAEEAVQETLTRIYRFLDKYQQGSFLAWSMQIVRNVCVDVATREGKHRHLRVVDEHQDVADPVASDRAQAVEVRMRIDSALGKLTETHRTVFLLTVQGLHYEEIARICGVPIGTVRSRLFHARAQLREMLTDLVEEEQ
jgi:RNA polymerase sigma-70 factor, ECF subfamily